MAAESSSVDLVSFYYILPLGLFVHPDHSGHLVGLKLIEPVSPWQMVVEGVGASLGFSNVLKHRFSPLIV